MLSFNILGYATVIHASFSTFIYYYYQEGRWRNMKRGIKGMCTEQEEAVSGEYDRGEYRREINEHEGIQKCVYLYN